MMAARPLSDAARLRMARKRAILAAYCAGEKAAVISVMLGVSERHVSKVAAEAGVARAHGRPPLWEGCPPEFRDRFRRLRHRLGWEPAKAQILREMQR